MFGMGMQELLVILVIILLLFGPRRLPDLAKSLGQSLSEFKNAMRGDGAKALHADVTNKDIDGRS